MAVPPGLSSLLSASFCAVLSADSFVLRLFCACGGAAGIAVRGGTAGTGIGNGDRAPGTTHQQARCEHANTCSEAQMRQNHDLPPSQRSAASVQRLPHSRIVRPLGVRDSQAKYALNGQEQTIPTMP